MCVLNGIVTCSFWTRIHPPLPPPQGFLLGVAPEDDLVLTLKTDPGAVVGTDHTTAAGPGPIGASGGQGLWWGSREAFGSHTHAHHMPEMEHIPANSFGDSRIVRIVARFAEG